MKTTLYTTLAVCSLTLFFASGADADCVSAAKKTGHSGIKVALPSAFAASAATAAGSDLQTGSIVGLWTVTFLNGNGPGIYDQGFELWHSDGTELTLDVAVPPAAGNVCIGVWEQIDARSVKLHHVGWNWDLTTPPGTLAGTFVLDMTVTLGARGKTFSGRYVTDSFDVDGKVIPTLHAEGVVRGDRITVR